MGYDKYGYFVDQIEFIYEARGDDWEKQIKLLLDIMQRQQNFRTNMSHKKQNPSELEDDAILGSFDQLRQ